MISLLLWPVRHVPGGARAPTELAVQELEGGGQHCPNVGHVDEHQGDPNQGIQHGHQLPKVSARRQITIAWNKMVILGKSFDYLILLLFFIFNQILLQISNYKLVLFLGREGFIQFTSTNYGLVDLVGGGFPSVQIIE